MARPTYPSQIIVGNAFATNLQRCYVFNEGSGTIAHDISTNAANATADSGAALVWDSNGLSIDVNTNTSTAGIAFSELVLSTNWTIDWQFSTHPGSDVAWQTIIAQWSDTNGIFYHVGQFELYNSAWRFGTTAALATHYCLTMDSTAGGVFYTGGSSTDTKPSITTWTLNLNEMFNDNANERMSYEMEFVRVWNRVLSSSEVSSLAASPYQFIQAATTPPVIRLDYKIK